MAIEHHYRWRCRNPWGKTFTTRFHCTEEHIRREHPEAEAEPGSLIVRTISAPNGRGIMPSMPSNDTSGTKLEEMRAEQKRQWADPNNVARAGDVERWGDPEPRPGGTDHAAWVIREEARAWRAADALMARAREGERKPGESEDRPG